MPLHYLIRRATRSQQFRVLIVRAVEGAIVMFMIGVGICAVCVVVGWLLRLLGVA